MRIGSWKIMSNPIDSRLKLPVILKRFGVGVELGVAKGYYSDIILKHSKLKRLYSIDSWADHHNDEEYAEAQEMLEEYGDRSIIMRMTFDEALGQFYDNELDFIYVDGYAHTGQDDGKIMRSWYPKLKSGGIMAGHDYTEMYKQTIEAVDNFCVYAGVKPMVIPGDFGSLNGQDHYESWWFRKPSSNV